ncbi:protein lifeguard 1 [Drosophila willistoni]|uniref:protein lifeguard 1 n=1 Tax=Drosophila willistoni TaxID=7260 RepID=UPI000C26CB2B|nr:protein lifeguard 1 [Drosophila willistoni]
MASSIRIDEGQDIAIQCELLINRKKRHGRIYEFDITDIRFRRSLVRRFYAIIILQIVLCIPCIEILLAFPLQFMEIYNLMVTLLNVLIYTCLYILRDWRRTPPYNYLALLLTTICSVINRSLYTNTLGRTHWIQIYPVALIFELVALMLYSKQYKFKFNQIYGIIVLCLAFSFFLVLAYQLNQMMTVVSAAVCIVEGWYVLYDTQHMLCGRHGYNLKSHEHIYAACNIYADIPKFVWSLFKVIFLSQIIGAFRFCRDCCRSEVC